MKINGVELPLNLTEEQFSDFFDKLPNSGITDRDLEEIKKTGISFTIEGTKFIETSSIPIQNEH